MPRRRKKACRPRVPVSRRAGQVFRAVKGRGSYARRRLKAQLRREERGEE